MNSGKLQICDIDAFVFDFDGVLTNNHVYVDQSGSEQVCCSRADGLAFDVFRKLNANVFVLSTEKNPVVTARAKKLNIPVIQDIHDKVEALKILTLENKLDLSRVIYIGNDLNDYHAMKLCGISVCPADSHPVIREISTYQLTAKGGYGVARELVEDLLDIDILSVLYS